MPEVTFDGIGCKTAAIHATLGDTVWNGYWQEKANVVSQTDFVPTTMHNALRHIVTAQHEKLSAMAGSKEEAIVRHDAARSRTAQTALGYSPM